MSEKNVNLIDLDDEKNNIKVKTRKRISEFAIVTYLFVAVFILMIFYFAYFIQYKSQAFIQNSYNTGVIYADNVIRGDIKSSDDKVLATTKIDEDGNENRVYPYNEMFSHVVGYVSQGMSGLEASLSSDLLQSHLNISDRLSNDFNGEKSKGDTIYTTLNSKVQQAAYEGLGFNSGAVVAMDPDSGEILCMVSKPDFDPNMLSEYWDFITREDNDSSILLNRAIAGLYPPGSTFKIVTTLSYLEQEENYKNYEYYCNGQVTYNDYDIHCAGKKSHGSETLKSSFGNSCNCSFANIGTKLDIDKMEKTADRLLFNQEIPTDLSGVKESTFSLKSNSPKELIGQTAIGQGETTVTPLHMCMIASAICNDGILMEPHIIKKTVSADNYIISETKPVKYGTVIESQYVDELQEYMRYVVTDGTAKSVEFGDYVVCGKTGSAEFTTDKSQTHSWFVGYAYEGSKKLAIAVIMEGAGSGSKYAAPLAKDVFNAYFD